MSTELRIPTDFGGLRKPHEGDHPWQPALRTWVTLARAYAVIVRAAAKDIAGYDVSLTQYAVLEALYHKGPLPLGEISSLLLVTGGNITYVVDQLEKRGFVRRERAVTDRRVIYAALTPEGEELIERTFPRHAEFIGDLFSALGDDESHELHRLLKKLGLSVAERTK
jgi:MarR family 2-MHQ and catechol resistance regulon transcriptional repressor